MARPSSPSTAAAMPSTAAETLSKNVKNCLLYTSLFLCDAPLLHEPTQALGLFEHAEIPALQIFQQGEDRALSQMCIRDRLRAA